MRRWMMFFVLAGSLYAGDIVIDSETGLMWQDSSEIVQKDWEGAKRYCQGLRFGGHSDWRLPHLDELMSITDRSRFDPAVSSKFKHTKRSHYWSATEAKSDASLVWLVYFRDGNDNWYNKSNRFYIRCVRVGQ